MRPQIRATGLTKIYPAGPKDIFSNVTLKQALLNRAPAQMLQPVEIPAVNQVDLTICAGERLGIVGRNGAGKSTLLSMLAGLAEPTSGRLEIEGHVTAVMTLGIGLREDLSGRENIYIDGEIQGKSRAEIDGVIDEIIGFADLGEFIDHPIRTYSTGMKARLAFAMIINIDPEILIIDETLSVGDAEFSIKATKKIHEICARGKIVIIVAHGMGSIVDMCNRCIWMERGRIIMDGNPADVTTAYISSILRADEELLLEKFRRHHGATSCRPACKIARLEIYRPGNDSPSAIFTSGEPITIRIQAQFADTKDVPDIIVKIVRFDGLMVCESRLPDTLKSKHGAMRNSLACEAALEPLLLGAGVYQLRAELRDAGELLAHRTTIFEVQVNKAPVGASPALIYPCSIKTALRA